jgi:Fe-S cluster assembly protein SufD
MIGLTQALATGAVDRLPGRRDEDWRWSDLRGLIREIPPPAADVAPAPNAVLEALEGQGVLVARFVSSTGSQSAELPMVFGTGTKTVLVESYEHAAPGGVSAVTLDYELEEGAQLERIVMVDDAADAITVSQASVRLAAGARFSQTVLASGARRQRIETRVAHPGQGAAVRLDGIYLVPDRRHADITTVVEHAGRDGTTSQLTKGAVSGSGRGVFQGRIVVDKGADGTDARMGHHALILSDKGEVDAKPELLIYADDVACAHGNTVGNLDENALFYARQRGIPEAEARAMLTEAFLGQVVDRIEHDAVREIARAWVADRLRDLA